MYTDKGTEVVINEVKPEIITHVEDHKPSPQNTKSIRKKSIEPIIWDEDEPIKGIRDPKELEEISAVLKFDTKEGGISKDPKRDDVYLDNPEDYFDNTPSNLRPNNKGKYKNLDELKKLIDEFTPPGNNQSSKFVRHLGNLISLGITLTPIANLVAFSKRMVTVPQGKFQIVNKGGVYTTILKEGKHFLFNYYDSYEGMLDVDDEEHHIRSVGPNIKIVQVKPNHIGMVRLVNTMKYNDPETDKEIILGNAGDMLILHQGNYVFREDEFYDAKVYNLNDDAELVNGAEVVGENNTKHRLAIMTVKKNKLGCAYHIESGKHHLFEEGKRRIFDTKEWRTFELKEITQNFTLGPWLFITVEKGKHVCMHKKDGNYIIISEPGRYKFHKGEWLHDQIEIKDKDTSVEFKKFWIFSPPHNHYAEVQDIHGQYHTLEHGKKYYLEKDKFKQPIFRDKKELTSNFYIELGSKWVISPSKNMLIGAWNIKTNKFEIFDNLEAATEFPKDTYPAIEKINKLSIEPQKFGPYLTYNVAPGKKGVVAEENGQITCKEPGFIRVDGTATIRESLPDRPIIQTISLKSFYSKDLYDLQGQFDVQFNITDHKELSNKLDIDKMSFEDFKKSISEFIKGKLSQLLRNYSHDQLTYVKGSEVDINKIYTEVMEALSRELQDYSKRLKLGIDFGQAKLASDIKLNDEKVKKNYFDIANSLLEIQAQKSRDYEKEEKGKSSYEVNKKEIERTRDLDEKNAALEKQKATLGRVLNSCSLIKQPRCNLTPLCPLLDLPFISA